jgi:hypothetical protein
MNKLQQFVDWIQSQSTDIKDKATKYYNDCIASEGIEFFENEFEHVDEIITDCKLYIKNREYE